MLLHVRLPEVLGEPSSVTDDLLLVSCFCWQIIKPGILIHHIPI